MEKYVVRQVLIALCAYLGQMLVGCGLGWSSPVIPKLRDPDQTPLPDVITEGQGSWVGSVLYIGCVIGPYASGYLSNRYGRKPCLFLGGILTAGSFLLLATSVNLAMIFAGRIITGLGTSMIHVVNLVYLGEIASTDIRGMILTGSGIFSTMGTLFVYATIPYVSYSVGSYIILSICCLYIVGLFFIPESPVFHVMTGNDDEAKEVLENLGRTDNDDAKRVLSAKEEKVPTATSGWRNLFSIRTNRKALLITFVLNMLQQLSGVMVVTLFATTIFELAGSTIQPDIATIIIGVTQMSASCVTPFCVERAGRKILLLLSTAMCCLSLTVLGIYFYLDDIGQDVTVIGWLPLVTLIIFFISYDLGFGIIPSTFIGEMFTSDARSTGSTFTITAAWLFGFGVSTSFAYVIASIGGHYTFWVFATACAGAFFFTLLLVPETRGRTLIEIQQMLGR